jgi:site-specific DNA-methyltransferase (adenine-specific)
MIRTETIGSARLMLGDCREILPTLERPDAIVADPPYGQRLKVNIEHTVQVGRGRNREDGARNHKAPKNYPFVHGDDSPFDPRFLLDAADKQVIWGAHKFGHLLPAGRCLVWDKVPTGKVRAQGDGETAWCSVNPTAPLRCHRLLWDGLSIGSSYETRVERSGGAQAPRVHPTQKPVDLMSWCLTFLDLQPGAHICDSYMGGGSTGIAAMIGGFRFTGIEIEPRYFDAACRRIEAAYLRLERDSEQGSMFEGIAA